MTIRIKLLLLLLVTALVPLIFVTAQTNRGMRRLGNRIADQARASMIHVTETQLERFVADKAQLIEREGRLIELALQVQAREAERLLAIERPDNQRAFFDQDYDSGQGPVELYEVPRYRRLKPDGGTEPIPVSLQHQVIKLAPGAERAEVATDVNRLVRLTPTYQALHTGGEQLESVAYWQYTSLESGVHSCYPGHGGYPDDYDPRKRRWYEQIKKFADELRSIEGIYWTQPYIEVSTRKLVLTAGKPIFRPDGSFAGVTAIDIIVADVSRMGEYSQLANSTAYMVVLVPKERSGGLAPRDWWEQNDPREMDQRREEVLQMPVDELGLFILAMPEDTSEAGVRQRWQSPVEAQWLQSPHVNEFYVMLRDMQQGKSGVTYMDCGGVPCIWGYGQIWKNGFLVVTVPFSQVDAAATEAQARVRRETFQQLVRNVVVLAVVVLLVVFFTLRGSRAVTRPVRRLADAAERIAGGDLDAVVNVETNDELGHLSRTFNDMVPKLKDRLQLRESMSLAMEVQQSLLPSAPPQVDGLDVAGESIYCDETGGDYYDFLDVSPLGATRLAVAVGDVTGHGIAAALLMTAGRALLRSNAERVDSIAELLGAINKHLTADTPAGRFMTMFCAVIDSKQRHMRWASAGHDSPLIYLPASGDIHEFDDGGIPLGIEAEWRYEEFDYRGLEPGTVIVIGTDGVWESANAQGELYGKERLRELIRLHAADSAEVISDAITRSIAEFRGSEPQRDDVTLVVVKLVS